MVVTEQPADRVFARERFGTDWSCLDLINSEQWDGFGRRTDHLDDPTWREDLLARYDWTDVAGEMPPPLAELRVLRAALRRLVEAVATGEAPDPADIAILETALLEPGRRRVRRSGEVLMVEMEPMTSGWGWVLAEIAASAFAMLAEASRRIKVCANPGCRWAFHDRTKSNSRRWCNDRTCGNRDKVRRFRKRQTSAGDASG